MATYSIINDQISISPLDVRILVALLAGPENAYGIVVQCANDANATDNRPIQGNIYKALPKLEQILLVSSIQSVSVDPRRKDPYRITSLGRMILEQKMRDMASFLEIAQDRLENTAHQKRDLNRHGR